MDRTIKGTFAKGHGGFKPKGTKHPSVNQTLRERVDIFLSDHWQDLEKNYNQLSPKEQLYFFKELLPYMIPKLQATHSEISIRDLTEEQLNEIIDVIIE